MEDNCIFCKIAKHEIPATFLYESEKIIVFKDIKPFTPIHNLIVPVKHIRSINDLQEEDRDLIAEMMMVAKEIAKQEGVDKLGYKLLFNVEKGGGQEVFHLHLHLMAGFKK